MGSFPIRVVSPESVGLARDERGQGSSALYDGSEMLRKRVPYDVNQTLRDLRKAPLPAHVLEVPSEVLTGARLEG